MNFMPDGESGFSIAVYFNQFFSEMWDHPDFPDSDSYLAYLDEVYEDPNGRTSFRRCGKFRSGR